MMNIVSASELSLINFLTSIMSAITGLGGGTILIGLMPLFLPAAAIVPVHGATQFAGNISRVWFGRDGIDWTYIRPYLVGALVGTAVFGTLVNFVKLDLIPLFIAVYILLTQWSTWVNQKLKSLESFYVIGFLQTGIGLFVGTPGPLHMPLLMKKYDDNHIVVTTGSLMIVMVHLIKLAVYVFMGFAFSQYWKLIVMMVICSVAGSWAGVKLRKKLPMLWLTKALPYILTIIALKIIIDNAIKFGWIGHIF